MPAPRILILRAPGTNCNEETAFAFEQAGGQSEQIHVNRWLEEPALADGYQVLCIPGGFSYGDDVAAGRILANQLHHHLADALRQFHENDKLILGICNGFQALLKTGLLAPADDRGPIATLAWNDSGQFIDRWVDLRVVGPNSQSRNPKTPTPDPSPEDGGGESGIGSKCVFLTGIEALCLPIAHAEGKFVARDGDALAALDQVGQLALRYSGSNPNGSQLDVAGICDSTGRVFGLMPHPERFLDRTQHPRWTREDLAEIGDGLRVFENAVRYFA